LILGRIAGNAVAVEKHPCYAGKRCLVVQPVDVVGKDLGRAFLALDAVQAGEGDLVLASREGNTARQLAGGPEAPIPAVVLAVVDRVEGPRGEVALAGDTFCRKSP
jgi:microcompartment protein CcmK/EutM